jgi:hypothetical protein
MFQRGAREDRGATIRSCVQELVEGAGDPTNLAMHWSAALSAALLIDGTLQTSQSGTIDSVSALVAFENEGGSNGISYLQASEQTALTGERTVVVSSEVPYDAVAGVDSGSLNGATLSLYVTQRDGGFSGYWRIVLLQKDGKIDSDHGRQISFKTDAGGCSWTEVLADGREGRVGYSRGDTSKAMKEVWQRAHDVLATRPRQ